MYLQFFLEEQGHQVVVVKDGNDVLLALEKDSFDCILMDVMMPEMDGVEATRIIRESRSAALDPHIPIVALTAYAMTGDREKFMAAGMDDYITKPVDFEELDRVLERVMNRRPRRDF